MLARLLSRWGDRAFLARFVAEADAARGVAVRVQRRPGVIDVVLAYQSVAVFADPDQVDLMDLETRLRELVPAGELCGHGKRVAIPVLDDGADLQTVADRCNWASTT